MTTRENRPHPAQIITALRQAADKIIAATRDLDALIAVAYFDSKAMEDRLAAKYQADLAEVRARLEGAR